MPDPTDNRRLDELLGFSEAVPNDEFVLRVMQRLRKEQRRRRLILTVCGLVGAAFGAVGAMLLSQPLARILIDLPPTGTMQAVLIGVAAIAFYGWMMNEDIRLDT